MLDTIPNEKRKCHRCSFEKGCRELVMSGACERWRRIPISQDPFSGEQLEQWGCLDDHMFTLLADVGRQTYSTTVETNKLRNEVKAAHDEDMTLGAIAVQRAREAVHDEVAKTVNPLVRYVAKIASSGSNAVTDDTQPVLQIESQN